MKTNPVFGRTFDCPCGKTHTIQPRQIVYGEDALDRLAGLCAGVTAGRHVAVLVDARTRRAAGAEAARALSQEGWLVSEYLVPDPSAGCSPVCDDVTKEALAIRMDRCDLILSVGAGVINDLGKWLAMEAGVPWVTFATAASMNGYTSANVAPTLAGVKSLLRAAPPAAVVSSPSVLAAAPYELTAAGLGDVLAKSVSSADWKLNHLLFGDYYCRASVELIAEIEPLYLERPEALAQRDAQALRALFEALLLSGAAMTMAESSAPASGGEHLISHSLDMMSSLDGRRHDLHGRQVGVGTILASELYRRVLAVQRPRLVEPAGEVDREFWGPLAEEVARQYAQKLPRLRQAAEKLSQPGQWDDLRASLAAMLRPPETIRDCLAAAGAAWRAEHIGCDRHRLLAAFAHGHEIRSRFTILDLAGLVGVLPGAAGPIVQQWA